MLDIEFAQLSDCGRVRDHNEDYLGHVAPDSPAHARTHGWLFAVADGVGGQERGEVASKAAIESLIEGFRNAPSGESHTALLTRLIKNANSQVFETGRSAAPGGVAMATTLVACALRFDRVAVAHVGDSRCYLVRRGKAKCLTRDHTVVNEQIRLGLLSPREGAGADTKHLLTRSVGTEMFVGVETGEQQVFPGDSLVLCSDGLHGPVDELSLESIVTRQRNPQLAAQELIALANERDGGDNVSVQIVHIRAVERIGMYRGRPYKLP